MKQRATLIWIGASLITLSILAAPLSGAEIAGQVTNGTTGQPTAGVQINLLALREQMVPVREGETDSSGRYRFVVDANPSERFVVQVPFRGVLYSRPAVFSSGDRISVDIEVFETGARAEEVSVEAHTIFLEPHRDHLRLTEFYALTNRSQPPRAYAPEGGSFRFPLPGVVGDLQVSAGRAGGMPLRQQPQPTQEKNVLSIDYALRPGETEIQISYALPLSGTSFELRLPLRVSAPRQHLAVPKEGVRVEGTGLREIEQTQAPAVRVYAVDVKPPKELALHLTVDPQALAAAEESTGAPAAAAEGESQVQIVSHPVNEAQWYIVGLTLFVLLLGLYYLYAFHPAPDATHATAREPRSSAHD